MKRVKHLKINSMKNADLIKELQKYPDDMDVLVVNGNQVDDVEDTTAEIIADVYTTVANNPDDVEKAVIVIEYGNS